MRVINEINKLFCNKLCQFFLGSEEEEENFIIVESFMRSNKLSRQSLTQLRLFSTFEKKKTFTYFQSCEILQQFFILYFNRHRESIKMKYTQHILHLSQHDE